VAATLASHNLLTNRARELIKPSTDSGSLQHEIEKIFFGLDFGFFVCYVTMRACLGNFRPTLPEPGQCEIFFVQCFFLFLSRKRVFRGLDWLASVSWPKIMAQKPKNVQNFAP